MHNAKATAQLGRYYTLKSLQPLNLDELQYLHHGGLTPPKKECQGFFHKCIESFKTNFPKVKQFAEELFYEPVHQADVYGNAD
jgi:hypothetical protein